MWGSSVQLGNRKKLSESDLSGCSVSYPSHLMLQRLLIRPQTVLGQTTPPALFQLLFNCSVVSDSLWPNGLQHARLPCPSPSLRACSNMSIELVIPSSHLILCCPLLLLPSIFPSMRVFSNESALHIRWPKYWSFNFSISPSNEHPGLISFRMDWLNLLAVQGTLKSLQHHSSKASILQRSAFFIV